MEFRKSHSIFEQIADHVCNSVLAGTYKEGAKIPSVRQMAGEVQVNPNTIMRAYAHLQEQGILLNRRGIGFFCVDNACEIILARNRRIFIKEDIPVVFDNMLALGIGLSELEDLFNKHRNGVQK